MVRDVQHQLRKPAQAVGSNPPNSDRTLATNRRSAAQANAASPIRAPPASRLRYGLSIGPEHERCWSLRLRQDRRTCSPHGRAEAVELRRPCRVGLSVRRLVVVLVLLASGSGCRRCERPEFRFTPGEAAATAHAVTLVRDLSIDPNEALKHRQLGQLSIHDRSRGSAGPASICGNTTTFPIVVSLSLGSEHVTARTDATLSTSGNLSFSVLTGEWKDSLTSETATRSFTADIDLNTEDATISVFNGETTTGKADEWFATFNTSFGNQHWLSD